MRATLDEAANGGAAESEEEEDDEEAKETLQATIVVLAMSLQVVRV